MQEKTITMDYYYNLYYNECDETVFSPYFLALYLIV
jgi:hypothetical protein